MPRKRGYSRQTTITWLDDLPDYVPPPVAPDAVMAIFIEKKPKKQKG